MAVSIVVWERRARYAMGAVAVAGMLGLVAFELGWISTVPSYKEEAWYLMGGNASFVVTSEYADEAACRRKENSPSVCRSGKMLMEESRRLQSSRS